MFKEAEYAFKLNLPIIPLIMQSDYMPDGWLGIILGSKIYINFTKYPLQECIKRLKDEVMSVETKIIKSVVQNGSFQNKSCIDYTSWKESDVKNWAKNFDTLIVDLIEGFDGKMLKHLHNIKINAPEYYYSTISHNKTVKLKSCVKFSLELEQLFN